MPTKWQLNQAITVRLDCHDGGGCQGISRFASQVGYLFQVIVNPNLRLHYEHVPLLTFAFIYTPVIQSFTFVGLKNICLALW